MRKQPLLTALICVASISISAAQAKSTVPLMVSDSLTRSSITRVFNTTDNRPPDSHRHFCSDAEFEKPVPYFVTFTHPEQNDRTVAVLKYAPEKPLLNPREAFRDEIFKYGSIPPLERMTKSEALQLWGKSTHQSSSNNISFPLNYSIYSTLTKRIELKTGYLDVIFKNDQISEYRVRCEITNTSWIKVNKGGEWFLPALLLLGSVTTALLVKTRL